MQTISPLLWYQGLFLQPQHFQYLEEYCRSFSYPLMKTFFKDFWGVLNVDINREILNDMVFEVLQGEFIFRDGAWISYPGNARIETRSFEDAWMDPDKPFWVYVGLKRLKKNEKNVSFYEREDKIPPVNTRFICAEDPELVNDFIDPEAPQAQLKKMKYFVRVFWEDEIKELADFYFFPLVKLIREGGEIKIAQDFVPPSVTLGASSSLSAIFKSVRDQLTSRCRQLEEFKSPKEMQLAELDSEYLLYLMALRSLNRYVPLLYSFYENRHSVSPKQAYILLSQIVGELSTFTQRINALSETEKGERLLPGFDHEDPYRGFYEANQLIWELLNEIIIGPEYVVKLTPVEIGWHGELPPEILDVRNEFYLVLQTSKPESALLEDIKKLAKLCSLDCVFTLVSRALPGIPLEYVAVPPPGLPRKKNTYYFLIDREHSLWEYVQRDKNIALAWEGYPQDLKVEVVVMKK